MPRFFVTSQQINDQNINIYGSDVNHIRTVLRMSVGDKIRVCDGIGNEYSAIITSISREMVTTDILEIFPNKTELDVRITLLQAIPKSDKMDFVIQKTVELGIYEIIPVVTERVVTKIDKQDYPVKKHVRWNRISVEAAKQCNRGILPQVFEPMGFLDAMSYAETLNAKLIMPYENEEERSLKSVLSYPVPERICLFIGPEGGISQHEAEKAVECGFIPVTLGKRILRTETAGMAVLAALDLLYF
ncbi:MAG: 16S rRNA (uracil(1498)-N(3))-methyltransferase [Clostridiales bacterium]|jgi:16S rRNA (uracil1498-N3)-methyltransferase|nr:16S rRNA (uracil(1498)-N(3))-methyltransferase [Clostridiales bacterium]